MILTKAKISDITVKPEGAKRVLYFSDLHVLHRRTPTHIIIEDLKRQLVPELLYSLDALYILGDFWDDSRHLRQEDTQLALDFMVELIQLAKEFNFGLRLLEGTPSHDHGQSAIAIMLNRFVGADVVYLDGLGIFKDEKLDMTVGYVRDEYKDTAIETEKEMRETMKTHGLKLVDKFVMHGCFTFQLPVFKKESFNEKFWMPRCRHGIFIGHDHKPKLYGGKIRVTGTPNRLSHNEEEDKGLTLVDYMEGMEAKAYFLVNEYAVPYLTVREQATDDLLYDECLVALKKMHDHPNGRYGRLRIMHSHDSNIGESIRKWSKEFPFIITGDKQADPNKEKELQLAFEPEVAEEKISKDNLHDLLFDELEGIKFDRALAAEILDKVA